MVVENGGDVTFISLPEMEACFVVLLYNNRMSSELWSSKKVRETIGRSAREISLGSATMIRITT